MVGVEFQEPRKHRMQVLVHGQQGPDGKEKRTGIKHCIMNLIRVMHQKVFMDQHPSEVLILPILTVDEVLRFGEPRQRDTYWIAVICGSPDIYKQMVLTGEYEICSNNDLDCALQTLRRFTFAVAEHARDNVQDADLASIVSEKTVLKPARNLLLRSNVHTPALYPVGDQPPRVLKLRLANDGSGATTCDPWLLCMKSAVMFSSYCGNKLLPGCIASPAAVFSSTTSWYDSSHENCELGSKNESGWQGRVPGEINATSADGDTISETSIKTI